MSQEFEHWYTLEGTREMYGYPQLLRDSWGQAKRRNNEILRQVRAERLATQARNATRTSAGYEIDSIVVKARQRLGRRLIAAGRWIGGPASSPAPSEAKSPA